MIPNSCLVTSTPAPPFPINSSSFSLAKANLSILWPKSCLFPSCKYGTKSCTCIAFAWNDRPGERWKFPITLLTWTFPAILHPSSIWAFIRSVQPSLTHCSPSCCQWYDTRTNVTRADVAKRGVREGEDKRTCSIESGLTKLHPLRTYASLTSSQVLQQPGLGPSVGGVPPKHDRQTIIESKPILISHQTSKDKTWSQGRGEWYVPPSPLVAAILSKSPLSVFILLPATTAPSFDNRVFDISWLTSRTRPTSARSICTSMCRVRPKEGGPDDGLTVLMFSWNIHDIHTQHCSMLWMSSILEQ